MAKMRQEYEHEKVGGGFIVQSIDANKPSNKYITDMQYDIEFAYGGRYICTLSTNCYGEQARKYWFDYGVKVMKRYMHIIDQMNKMHNNLLAYSKNYLMNEPKSGYEQEWAETQDTLNMFSEWLKDMTNRIGGDTKLSIIEEFYMYYR